MPRLRDRIRALFARKRTATRPRRGTGSALIGAGALELQGLLQPDRKVEVILEQVKTPDRFDPAHRPGRPGDLDPESDTP